MSVQNIRRLDHLATTTLAIPSIVLMENAATAISKHATEMLKAARNQHIIIATGPGNNAGDGFAAARHLQILGYQPQIITITPPETIATHAPNDTKINLDIISKMNIEIIPAQTYLNTTQPTPGLIIDALFGTGLTRPITNIAAQLINHLNACKPLGSKILAVDVPSGLNAQTGEPTSPATIAATRTITLAALKDGYRAIDAQPFLGELFVDQIGIPTQLLKQLGTQVQSPQDRPNKQE